MNVKFHKSGAYLVSITRHKFATVILATTTTIIIKK